MSKNLTVTSQQKDLLLQSNRDIDNTLAIASNGGKLLSARQPVTIDKVLGNKQSLSVGFLRKQSEETEQKIISLYVLAIAEASRLFPNTFDSNSITDTAFMLLNEYPDLKSEEIIIILKNGIAGKYGKMFHAISCAAIMEWALNYQTERQQFLEKEILNKGRELQINNFAEIKSETVKKEFRELKEKVTTNYIHEQKEKQKAWNTVLQNIVKEFDELHRKQKPGDVKAMRFVKYKDNEIDFETYCTTRIKELQ